MKKINVIIKNDNRKNKSKKIYKRKLSLKIKFKK